MGRTQDIGNRGEQIAAEYLQKRGYTIIARNWRVKTGEIDIIGRHNGALVFVEVKLRGDVRYGQPEETVTFAKQQKLIRTAELYCQQNRVTSPWRIDVIAITPQADGTDEILHLENAVTG